MRCRLTHRHRVRTSSYEVPRHRRARPPRTHQVLRPPTQDAATLCENNRPHALSGCRRRGTHGGHGTLPRRRRRRRRRPPSHPTAMPTVAGRQPREVAVSTAYAGPIRCMHGRSRTRRGWTEGGVRGVRACVLPCFGSANVFLRVTTCRSS